MRQLLTILIILLPIAVFSQIPINTPFSVSTPNPIDTRMTIATLSDTSTIVDLYDGLLTVVQDINEVWQYDGSKWINGVGAKVALTENQIAFGSAANEVTSSPQLTYTDTSFQVGPDSTKLQLYLDKYAILFGRDIDNRFSPDSVGNYAVNLAYNSITPNLLSTVIGGGFHQARGNGAIIAGGFDNQILRNGNNGIFAGARNINDGNPASVILGGDDNQIEGGAGWAATVGGRLNYVDQNPQFGAILGGTNDTLLVGDGAIILGGRFLHNDISYSAVCGQYNDKTSNATFAVGNGSSLVARSNAFEVFNSGEFTAGNYLFNSDQSTTGLGGNSLQFNSGTGQIELAAGPITTNLPNTSQTINANGNNLSITNTGTTTLGDASGTYDLTNDLVNKKDTLFRQYKLDLSGTGDTIQNLASYTFDALTDKAVGDRVVAGFEITTTDTVGTDFYFVIQREVGVQLLPSVSTSFMLDQGTSSKRWYAGSAPMTPTNSSFQVGDIPILVVVNGSGTPGVPSYVASEGSNSIWLTIYYVKP